MRKVEDYTSSVKNPYKDAYIWIKGELLDVIGMMDAVNGRQEIIKKQTSTEEKRASNQKELDKVSMGKTTMKSLFKSKSGKEKQ